MISERPAEIEDRAVPGHWEGDLLLGKLPTGIATLVERSTRFCQLVELPEGHRAEAVREALVKSIGSLLKQLRRSLTWDQGKEMLETRESDTLGLAIDYAVGHRDRSWTRFDRGPPRASETPRKPGTPGWAGQDSNLGAADYESAALTN